MGETVPPPWYRPRGYRHFDPLVDWHVALNCVSEPKRVISHSFLPLLSYAKQIPRYDPNLHKVVTKDRQIAYASHMDAQIFAYYAHLLADPYEKELRRENLSDCVIAYRSIDRKSNIEFAAEVFAAIENMGNCVALGLDITGFFDHINHAVLKQLWSYLLMQNTTTLPLDHYKVFKALTKYAHVNRDRAYNAFGLTFSDDQDNRKPLCTPQQFGEIIRGGGLIKVNTESYGIPQGTPVSAIASNISMLPFDRIALELATEVGGLYRRYSDDIFFLSPPNLASYVELSLTNALHPLGLEFKSKKTERTEFEVGVSGVRIKSGRPFPYLGFVFDGKRRLIRSSSLSRYYQKTKKKIRMAKIAAARAAATGTPAKPFRRLIYQQTTHLGQKRTFLRYAYRADKIMPGGSIRRQIKPHWKRVKRLLDE